jgi:hypothetical protein
MGGSGRAVHPGAAPNLLTRRPCLNAADSSTHSPQDLLEANLEVAASKGRRAKKGLFRAIQSGDFGNLADMDDLEEALAPGALLAFRASSCVCRVLTILLPFLCSRADHKEEQEGRDPCQSACAVGQRPGKEGRGEARAGRGSARRPARPVLVQVEEES